MELPDLRLLGCAEGRPHLNVIDLADRSTTPCPVSLGDEVPIGNCLPRDGWIAGGGEEVWGIPLPLPSEAFRVASSFTLVPGHDARTVWYEAGRAEDDQPRTYAEYDGVARAVRAEVVLPAGHRLEAETRDGLIVSVGDALHLHDRAGRPLERLVGATGVRTCHGSLLLCEAGEELLLLDAGTRTIVPLERPAGGSWEMFAGEFSPDGTQLALSVDMPQPDPEHEAAPLDFATVWNAYIAGGREGELPWVAPGLAKLRPRPHRLAIVRCADGAVTLAGGEFDNVSFRLVWSADGEWVVFDAPFQERGLWLCRRTEPELRRVEFEHATAAPVLDVSDAARFGPLDREHLRAALRPRWQGPIPAPIRDVLLDVARERLRAAGADLASASRAIRLRSCAAPARVAIGASRLGGRPDLPPGHAWPSHDGTPMTFLAQLGCDELAATGGAPALPPGGLLTIFVDLEADAVHVEILPPGPLKRRPWPAALPAEGRYGSALAVAEPMLSVPGGAPLHAGPQHQLFGHPRMIQEGPEPETYELLLQFDGDSLLGAAFGDGGRLHVWRPAGTALDGVLDGCVAFVDCY